MSTVVRLRDLGTTYGGLTGKTKDDFGSGDSVYVTFLEVINSTRLRGRALERVKVAKGERQFQVIRGDLLFNGSSETPEEVALSAVVDFDPGSSTFLNSFCFGYRLRPDALVDPTYLAYFFRSPAGRSAVASLAQGATRYNIAKTKFLDLELALPSIKRQRAIVEAINDIEDLVSSLGRMIIKKQDIRRGMMQELLTGRRRLPGFTGSWSKTTLGSLGTFLKGRGIKRDDVRSTGTGCIRYGELYTTFNDYTEKTRSFVSAAVAATALPLGSGDLLFAGSGETRDEIGKCVAYIGESSVVAGGDVIVLRGDQVNSVYLALLANTPEVVAQKARAGQGDAVVHIYSHALAAIEVDMPSRAEQDAVARLILDVDRELARLRQRLGKARDIKQGMMQELLLTGRTPLPVQETVA